MDKHLKTKNVIFNVQVIGVTGLFRESYSQAWFNKKNSNDNDHDHDNNNLFT